MKKKHTFRNFFITTLAVLVCLVVFINAQMSTMKKQTYKMLDSIEDISLEKVNDGVFIGDMETELVKVTVEVTVKGHVIKDIKLLRHENGKGTSAESLIPLMVERNTTDVEIVSGATMSSKVIIAATRNALSKGVD